MAAAPVDGTDYATIAGVVVAAVVVFATVFYVRSPILDRIFHICLFSGVAWWTWGWTYYYLFAVPSAGLAVIHAVNLVSEQFSDKTAYVAQEMYSVAMAGNLEQLKALIKSGCPVDAAMSKPVGQNAWLGGRWRLGGSTALHGACTGGHLDVLNVLISAGANLDARRHAQPASDLRTALHVACEQGHESCALRLVEAGAKTDIEDAWGLTPRALALHKGHNDLAKALKKKGAA